MALSFRVLSADSPVIQAFPEARPRSDNIILIHSPSKGEKPKKFQFADHAADRSRFAPAFCRIRPARGNLMIDVARLYQYIVAPC